MSSKGAGNLETFNSVRSAHTIPLLMHELKLYRKRKLVFKTPGLLAAHLSDRLNVHRTTLTRNPAYLKLLLEHLAGQPSVVERTPDSTTDPAILQAKLAVAKLDISTLRQEVKAAAAKEERRMVKPSATSEGSAVAFADLAAVMVTVLSRFPDFLELNFQKRELVDLSARPSERMLAGPARMRGFCTWVEQNQSLPHIQQLIRFSKKG